MTRKENVTARRAPTNAFVRLVPVSIRTAPTLRPGTGLSTGFGAGGGGGSIGIGAVRRERAPAAVPTRIGPVTAPIGTVARSRVSLAVRTRAETSSPLP